jgi:hypothetical protein
MYREIHAPFPGRPEAETVPAVTETAKTQQIGEPLRNDATPETAETDEDDHDRPIGWLDVC